MIDAASSTVGAYKFFKDFAGPIATVFAAAAAVIVTAHFNKRQTKIAEAQKDIALDKLKHDLFNDRYEIYKAAKDLLKCAARYGFERTSAEKIIEMKVKLDEARFFFPPTIQALTLEIEKACESVMLQVDRRAVQDPNDTVAWATSADRLAESEARLREMYGSLPMRFEDDLRFEQLTRSPN